MCNVEGSPPQKLSRAEVAAQYKALNAADGSSGIQGGNTMTEKELRAKVVSIAEKYLGCKESNGSHRKIIDLYNSHKPLARGYPVKYTDAWCATFVSAVFIEAG